MKSKYGINVTENNQEAVKNAEIVLLAVKPQVIQEVFQSLKGKVPSKSLVFSIVAGMPISTLQKGLAHKAVIRAMPFGRASPTSTNSRSATGPAPIGTTPIPTAAPGPRSTRGWQVSSSSPTRKSAPPACPTAKATSPWSFRTAPSGRTTRLSTSPGAGWNG
ncbi:MAG: NAD(P)-binding domain-containing protein [Anaerolineales bacterium]